MTSPRRMLPFEARCHGRRATRRTIGAELRGIRGVARTYRCRALRRRSRSGERRGGDAESAGRPADDRYSCAARAEDAREPDGGGAPTAGAGVVRAPPSIPRGAEGSVPHHPALTVTARVTFLGTGTSHGVPMIGCDCDTCRSSDPRDRRLRPSIYLEVPDGPRVLVDASPDLRQQALTHGIRRVDAVLFTHGHADHILGLDELRRFNAVQGGPIPC